MKMVWAINVRYFMSISGCQFKLYRKLSVADIEKMQSLGATVVLLDSDALISAPINVGVLALTSGNDIVGPLSDMESILLNKKRNIKGCTNSECGVANCESC